MARVSHLNVNGTRHAIDADAETKLLWVIRDHIGLTGTKFGCGEGECSACLVLIDGQPRHSCYTTVGEVGESHVTTIESLEQDGKLHPVQEAFLEEESMQCSYCTSGMILGTVALLAKNPHPTRAQIIEGMNGHICRCGTYDRIIRAVERAAERMKGQAMTAEVR